MGAGDLQTHLGRESTSLQSPNVSDSVCTERTIFFLPQHIYTSQQLPTLTIGWNSASSSEAGRVQGEDASESLTTPAPVVSDRMHATNSLHQMGPIGWGVRYRLEADARFY